MKKLLLFPTLILISMGAFAQLTVKPVGTTGPDSFIYVDNEILYVKNDINLTLNRTTQQEASIYLRDRAQLIQGGTTSTNTGNGFLSVQQNTPESNQWAYYYWASPVGNPVANGGPSNAGNKYFGVNSIYENLFDPMGIKARVAATVPTPNGVESPLTISTRWLYKFTTPGTEQEGVYIRINSNNDVPAGFGFTMKGVGETSNNQLYEFRGRPNSGDFTVTIGATPLMVLSGNPYPSALDLNQVFYETGNEEIGDFRYYDEDRTVMSHMYRQKPFGYGVWTPGPKDTSTDKNLNNPPGNYVAGPFFIWNASGGSNPGSGTIRNINEKRYAPIGQGFMLVGKPSGGNGPVTIKNSHRIYVKEGDPGSVFYRPDNSDLSGSVANSDMNPGHSASIATLETDNRLPQLRLYVVFDGAITRDMLITFSDQATDGYDRGFDGSSPEGLKSDAYFPIEIDGQRKPFVINGTNFHHDKRIPISFKLYTPGRIELLVAEEVRKPYRKLYLYDIKENTYMELRGDNSDGVILALPAGEHNDRYYIVFKRDDLESLPWPKEALDEFKANVGLFQNNPVQRLEVLNPEGYDIKSLNVYDMSGKLVISEKNLGDNTTYSFYTGNLSDGVYLVKLLSADDMPIDYKAIIMNK